MVFNVTLKVKMLPTKLYDKLRERKKSLKFVKYHYHYKLILQQIEIRIRFKISRKQHFRIIMAGSHVPALSIIYSAFSSLPLV